MKEEEKNKEVKEEKKEPSKPIVMVPEVDKDGHTVFRCLSKNEEVFVKNALNNPHGIKIKSAEGKTCPVDGTEYKKSICKKLDDLFKKAAKKAIEKEE